MQEELVPYLIAGCQKGDRKCQHQMYEMFADLLFATALRYMGNEHDAKDILQDSFVRIFKYIKKFDPQKGEVKYWMQKICVNECVKSLVKKKKMTGLPAEFEHEIIAPDILSQLNTKAIHGYIQSLNENHRIVFNLRVIEGYSHKEIATMIGVEVSSSRSLLTRAKQQLRSLINKEKRETSWT